MKKALVVGGSNGIGLAVAFSLIKRGYYVIILDIAEPDESIRVFEGDYAYFHCDLSDMNEELVTELSKDNDIEILMITAGIGWVCPFELLHTSEIDKIISINTTSVIKIINIFYNRMLDDEYFCCGVMCSLAGYISSPLFSVYAASKAALVRFTESVNIELEKKNSTNRILNISPSHIKGTKFGGENTSTDMESVSPVADCIVDSMINRDEILFPEYENVISGVLKRYNSDPHMFGLSSYEYKVNSGRVVSEPKTRIGYLSGTFDLFHVGHLNLLKRAKNHCDYLIVGVHLDASHKGKQTFIPFDERKKIIEAVRYVDKVVDSCPEDCDAWEKYHYTKLFVGSDYKGTERFKRYEEYFKDKGVEIVYFPYTEGTSSTQIREKIINQG